MWAEDTIRDPHFCSNKGIAAGRDIIDDPSLPRWRYLTRPKSRLKLQEKGRARRKREGIHIEVECVTTTGTSCYTSAGLATFPYVRAVSHPRPTPDASVIRLMYASGPNSHLCYPAMRQTQTQVCPFRWSLTDAGEAFGEAFLVFVGRVFEESIPANTHTSGTRTNTRSR